MFGHHNPMTRQTKQMKVNAEKERKPEKRLKALSDWVSREERDFIIGKLARGILSRWLLDLFMARGIKVTGNPQIKILHMSINGFH